MITPKLIGRFGNQVFQVSAAIAFALEHGIEFHIAAETENSKLWPPAFTHLQNPRWSCELVEMEYSEKDHSYSPITVNPYFPGNIVLNGYFQSEKYFKIYLTRIRELLFPSISFKPLQHTCSLHVRRGDYLSFADKHPPVTLEYISSAIDEMQGRGIHRFMVFSDDMKWCRENINAAKFTGCYFEYAESDVFNPLTDWLRMASCTHNIISNSSYSLTAAIYNPNPDKIIIAPRQWFGSGNAHLSTIDMYPENSIKL